MANESTMIKTLRSLTLVDKNLDYTNSKELGRGAYGKVFTVKYCGQLFAAKEIHAILLNSANKKEKDHVIKNFLQECHHCVNLRHPNIVQFIGVYWPGGQLSNLPVMVMELMDCSLEKFVMEKNDIKLAQKYSVLRDVALALSYLHAQTPPVIHRDLSPNNVLLNDRGVAKISDLGVARSLQSSRNANKNLKMTQAPGTLDFMPPEALCDDPVYDTSLDVFSFGGIMLFVINKQWPQPSAATEVDPTTRRIKGFTETQRRQKYLNKMKGGDQALQKLVENCLDNDPSRRPVITDVLQKLESLLEKSSEVGDKTPPPVSPKPKPRNISVPAVPRSLTPEVTSPRHLSLCPPVSPIHSTRGYSHSMPDSLDILQPKERRKMRVLLTLGEALESGDYEINWTRCADLPAPMYGASVAVSDQNVYVAAGVAPNYDIYQKVFCYNIAGDRWSVLPSPEHALGILCMVDGNLNLFGGNNSNYTATNRVSTYISNTNKWIKYFPAMIKNRIKPGVAVYLEHVIVVGGARDIATLNNDIEVLNWQQSPLEWKLVDIILPVPMWTISLTISSDKLLIVGYTQPKGRSTSMYQFPVKPLLEQPLYANHGPLQKHTWNKLCSAPHQDAALVRCSNPPVIVGGSCRGHPTSDVNVYDVSENRWKKCASLSRPRINVAVANIYDDTIIVFGGYTSGGSVEAAMESSLTIVEMGRVEESEQKNGYLKIMPRSRSRDVTF